MKLLECLNQLPDDMIMIDLLEFSNDKRNKIVSQLKLQARDEDGFEVRESKRNYGKEIMKSIGIVGGPNLYNQA